MKINYDELTDTEKADFSVRMKQIQDEISEQIMNETAGKMTQFRALKAQRIAQKEMEARNE